MAEPCDQELLADNRWVLAENDGPRQRVVTLEIQIHQLTGSLQNRQRAEKP